MFIWTLLFGIYVVRYLYQLILLHDQQMWEVLMKFCSNVINKGGHFSPSIRMNVHRTYIGHAFCVPGLLNGTSPAHARVHISLVAGWVACRHGPLCRGRRCHGHVTVGPAGRWWRHPAESVADGTSEGARYWSSPDGRMTEVRYRDGREVQCLDPLYHISKVFGST